MFVVFFVCFCVVCTLSSVIGLFCCFSSFVLFDGLYCHVYRCSFVLFLFVVAWLVCLLYVLSLLALHIFVCLLWCVCLACYCYDICYCCFGVRVLYVIVCALCVDVGVVVLAALVVFV